MAKEILVAYGVDIDAVAGWLGSYGGEDSPDDISRGLFAGEVGVPRLLKLFEKYKLPATWFAPGHSIETFPKQMKMIVEAGHEIGAHGYSHENPIAMSAKQKKMSYSKALSLSKSLRAKHLRAMSRLGGVFKYHQRAFVEARYQIRPLVDAQRFHALLCARWGQME